MGRTKKNIRAVMLCLGVFLIVAGGIQQVAAQSTAAILGTVVDASGAAMAEATISRLRTPAPAPCKSLPVTRKAAIAYLI